MHRTLTPPCLLAGLGLLASLALLHSLARPRPVPAAAPPALTYEREVRQFLSPACFRCHNDRKARGGINLAALRDEPAALRARGLWRKVARQIESRQMPPEGEAPLEHPERARVLAWVKHALARPAELDPGPAVVRRLTRSEYNRTLRDLIGADFDVAGAVGMTDEAGGHGFDNLAEALNLPPVLMDKYVAAADKALEHVFAGRDRRAHKALFVAMPGPDLAPRAAARKIIAPFLRRAYRRPVAAVEVERFLRLYDLASRKGEPFEKSVRLMLKAALVSPHFLFRLETEGEGKGAAKSGSGVRVSDHELAVRLSYFLWSSMPDEELSALADAGKLSSPAVLERQVKRMLASPKARALTDELASQWLQVRKLAEARPSTEFFPTFTHRLRQAMADEATTFFDKLREEDQSVLRLLDADHTYLNEDLAKHYGIVGVKGQAMRKVMLKPADHRGGLLGMAAVLSLTSHTSRTSPTLRGKWALEVIFGTPPPPPPPDVGKLEDAPGKGGKLPRTFRERMALHASRASCAGCHAKIDPLGYGLENYDAIGRWRDSDGGRPLDTSGKLPTGETFNGPAELKKIVLKRQDEFLRNLGERTLTYALGRELGDVDDPAIEEVSTALKANDARFSALVLAVVRSYPFQHKRATRKRPQP